jgi:hypothetical protein
MAKAEKTETGKKQALEEYLTAHPEASAKDAIQAMQTQGFDVSESIVYNAKWVIKKAKQPAAKQAQAKWPAKVAEAAPAEAEVATPEAPKITKTQAVRDAVKAHPKKPPKDIAALLQAEGWEVKPTYVSVVKSNMGAGKRKKQPVAAPVPEAGPVVPHDAVSLGLLQKAKKLAAQLGGIKEAKTAIDALAQILD